MTDTDVLLSLAEDLMDQVKVHGGKLKITRGDAVMKITSTGAKIRVDGAWCKVRIVDEAAT